MSFFFDAAKKIKATNTPTKNMRKQGTKENRGSSRRSHSRRRASPPISVPFKIVIVKNAAKQDRLIDGQMVPAGVTGEFYRIPVNLCRCGCLMGNHRFRDNEIASCENHPSCKKYKRATPVDCRRMIRDLKKR